MSFLFSIRCCFHLHSYYPFGKTVITSDFDFILFKSHGQNKIQCDPLPCTYETARKQLIWCWLSAFTLSCPSCSLGLKHPQVWHPMRSQPYARADLAGTDTDRQERRGLLEHPSCRATPFCTHQRVNELFEKICLDTISREWGELWVVLPTQGVIMCLCLGTQPAFKEERRAPNSPAHITAGWWYSWTMATECPRIYGNTRLVHGFKHALLCLVPMAIIFLCWLFVCQHHDRTRLAVLAC